MPDTAASAAADTPSRRAPERETFKTGAIGLIISFVMVLAFRGFAFESFHIPTGSMAPTLMGQHMRLHSPHSGFDWAMNPYVQSDGSAGGRFASPTALAIEHEPETSLPYAESLPGLRAGDRIGVLKYNPLYPPERWHVVVLKWPASPKENYIKRLVGLPGEEVWLVDGDVFVRRPDASDEAAQRWRIARKPRDVQEVLWWPLFSSEFTPIDPTHDGRPWRGPWTPADDSSWETAGREMRWTGAGDGALAWDAERWPITDWTPYNDYEVDRRQMSRLLPQFPTSDVRLRAAILPDAAGSGVRFTVFARGMSFEGSLTPSGEAILRMGSAEQPPIEVARADWTPLAPGRASDVAFEHVDQTLRLLVDGRVVLEHEYAWSPEERLVRSTTLTEAQVADLPRDDITRGNPLADPRIYRTAGASISIEGPPATLTRVGLDRDIHYQARSYNSASAIGRAALGTHPGNVASLSPDEFFLLGDNSANSLDCRLVDSVDAWVAERIDPSIGVVHRHMVTGRAVLVFWPAPHRLALGRAGLPIIPDFGRMRFIR